MALRNNPWIFSWRWKQLEEPGLHRRVVRFGDDVVIEGFPRSANTFATYAFTQANANRELKIGNHFHSPAQFLLAAKFGVPAMLVIRAPTDAVLSFMVFEPTMSAKEGLRRYIAFHKPLTAIRHSYVVVQFEEVISDFDRAIARLNCRFGTEFAPFGHTPERAKNLIELIDRDRAARSISHPKLLGDVLKNPIPSREKQQAQVQRREEFQDPSLTDLRSMADGLHAQIVSSITAG
jgi:hypothetical protein